jgi:hypothetical protein
MNYRRPGYAKRNETKEMPSLFRQTEHCCHYPRKRRSGSNDIRRCARKALHRALK